MGLKFAALNSRDWSTALYLFVSVMLGCVGDLVLVGSYPVACRRVSPHTLPLTPWLVRRVGGWGT